MTNPHDICTCNHPQFWHRNGICYYKESDRTTRTPIPDCPCMQFKRAEDQSVRPKTLAWSIAPYGDE